MSEQQRTYIAIDLKSFYASVECVDRGLDPLTTNLVVADVSRTEKNQIKMKLQQEESMSRKLTKKFMNQLKTHHSRFQQSYDLTQEKDIEEFLSWYKVLKRPVNKKTIKDIVNFSQPMPVKKMKWMRKHNL